MLQPIIDYNAYYYLQRRFAPAPIIRMGRRGQYETIVTSDLLLNKKTTWIVVADEAAATVYERKARHGPLTELFGLANEAGRKKTGELLADRGGRAFDSHGQGRHTMAKEKDSPKRHVAGIFAKTIAQRINSAVLNKDCDEFVLIAAPRFLGQLRAAVDKACNLEPALTIAKEMVDQDASAIQELIAHH